MARTESEELKERLEFSERRRAFLQKRLSKGSIEEDSTLWSFVDLMTLLLILFILFYSHAVTHKASTDNPSSPQPQTSVAQSPQTQNTPIKSEPVAVNQDEPKPDTPKTEAENPDASLEQLQQQVLQTVSKEVKKDFSIRWNQKRLVMVLGERIAFNVGEANLLPDFQPTLKQIAGFISSQKGYKVSVAGHTDDAPINTTRFPSNWELSAIRAVNVAKFMISSGVNPHRVSIEGYSAYRPLQANTTSDNKRENRRVEITLIKEPENKKAAEKNAAMSALDAYVKHPKAVNLFGYLDERDQAVPEYP
jgi:chemotaxis protein MotB